MANVKFQPSENGRPRQILLYNGQNPVLGDWVRDPSLQQAAAIQMHPVAGLLVATGGQIRRYSSDTGEFLHVLVDLGEEVQHISDFVLMS